MAVKVTPELLADLRTKAEAADLASQTDVGALAAHSDFGRVATPQTVIALLDRIEALEKDNAAALKALGHAYHQCSAELAAAARHGELSEWMR